MSDDQNEQGGPVAPFIPDAGGRIIRRQWHKGAWWFSVVDVVAILTESDAPNQYWRDMKRRMTGEGWAETQANCLPLKMRALDGKLRATDAASAQTMLRIVQSIPSPRAEPVKQWLARVGAQRLQEAAAELTEAERRQLLRGEVAEQTTSLNDAARAAGVLTTRDFAVFTDAGYKGLYNGETARQIAERKGLAKGEKVLDWMGSEELAANWFRITQTEAKLRRDAPESKTAANATHFAVGRAVRQTIAELGGVMPEQLPTPAESVQQLEARERERIARQLQPRLFEPGDPSEDPPPGASEG